MWCSLLFTLLLGATLLSAIDLQYLDPIKLQTVTSPKTQQSAALDIIQRYSQQVTVEVDPLWFKHNKDIFYLKTHSGRLYITASTGVAAVWGFNYYLKKYCKSQIEWQTSNVRIPDPLPEVDETVVANDRFRYYQNVCSVSYSFVWWNIWDWRKHVEWMALNGINLSLAPVAQEAIWARVYRSIGMTQEEIDKHFTGPAFLTWLRLGNINGWGGPLPNSWHDLQINIQIQIIDSMLDLGIIPVLPAFNGHVPAAFFRLFPDSTFYKVKPWNKFVYEYCCDMFIDPYDPLFKIVGTKFLKEMGKIPGCHIFHADPFNEVDLPEFDTTLLTETARIIYLTISDFDDKAVWLLQNWIFLKSGYDWPKYRVKSFLDALPNGRILVLDLEAERSPKYDKYDMYFGKPFIWCMLHNFGGTLGMFGNMITINRDVYEVRSRANSTMIGVGLTPEGINQNYVVYDLMLESAWRKSPVQDLDAWAADYAERRYGCNTTGRAWEYLLKSVYSYNGKVKVNGLYIVTKKPNFTYVPWAWYQETDLFEAFKRLVFVKDSNCNSMGYSYDVVDVTRQALQYKIEQLYVKMMSERETIEYKSSVQQFLEAFDDMALILAANENFLASTWFTKARALGNNSKESDLYEYNAWNQITQWGPNGQLNDYACKQWSEIISYYYRPGWAKFLYTDIKIKDRYKEFKGDSLEDKPTSLSNMETYSRGRIYWRAFTPKRLFDLPKRLYNKWASVPGIKELTVYRIIYPVTVKRLKDRSNKTTSKNRVVQNFYKYLVDSATTENHVYINPSENIVKTDSSENPPTIVTAKNPVLLITSQNPVEHDTSQNSFIEVSEYPVIETSKVTLADIPKNPFPESSVNTLNDSFEDLTGSDYLEVNYNVDWEEVKS